MKHYPLVSVVIPNHNGREFVVRCLKSVLTADYPDFEVIFVDNASSDGSVELVRKLFGSDPRLRTIRFSPQINVGASATRNEGVRLSRRKYIAFLDVDTEVDRDWLKELVNVMENDPALGSAQSKTLRMDEPEKVAGLGVLLIPCIGMPIIIGAGEEPDRYNYPFYIFAATEAMIVRREVLDKVGLFDPEIFWGEHLDLSYRIWLADYKEILVPTSIVYHAGGAKPKRKMVTFKSQFGFDKGNLLFILKNLSLKSLLKYSPLILLRLRFGLILSGRKHVVTLTLMDSLHKISATKFVFALFLDLTVLYCLRNLRIVLLKRRVVQRMVRMVPDDYVFKYVGPNIPLSLLLTAGAGLWDSSFEVYLKRYQINLDKS
jgi:GT2 family glycosyltransferase